MTARVRQCCTPTGNSSTVPSGRTTSAGSTLWTGSDRGEGRRGEGGGEKRRREERGGREERGEERRGLEGKEG